MYKRKDGRYCEALSVTENGRRKQKFFYGKTKKDVLDAIRRFEDGQKSRLLFRAVADEWDTEHREQSSYRGHAQYSMPYKTALDAFGDQNIGDIDVPQLDAYIKTLARQGYAKRTVRGYLSCVSLIFDYAIRKGYRKDNPAQYVKVPQNLKTTHRDVPSDENVQKIKDSVGLPFGLFAYFLLYTGCRRGEALALRYEDINFKDNLIHISSSLYWEGNTPHIKETKTEAGTRTIVLLDGLKDKLPRKKTGYVFGGDKPLTQIMFRRRWDAYVKASGITCTPHQLRHLFATILYEAGIDEKMAQEWLGHSSISVTRNIYTHIRQSKLQDAAELLNKRISI